MEAEEVFIEIAPEPPKTPQTPKPSKPKPLPKPKPKQSTVIPISQLKARIDRNKENGRHGLKVEYEVSGNYTL